MSNAPSPTTAVAPRPAIEAAEPAAPRRRLAGLFAYAITPTRQDEAVDERNLGELIESLVKSGVDGVTVLGSSGGIGSFAEAERMRIAEVAVAQAAGRVRVMVGTGAMTTAEAVRLAQHAERVGADGVLVVPITYWILNEHELIEHYRSIAASVRIPVCIYNNPRLTVIDMQPALIARLADIENVDYLKEASPELMRISLVRRLTQGRLHISSGRDGAMLEALQTGAEGWHSAVANIVPKLCVDLYRYARDDPNSTQTRQHYEKILPFTDFAVRKGLIRSIHTSFELLGRPMGRPRKPIQMLEGEDRTELARLLAALTA